MLSNINFETKIIYEKNAPITKRETFFIPLKLAKLEVIMGLDLLK